MKQFFLFICIVFSANLFSQDIDTYEKYPVFPNCESQDINNLKACFNFELAQFVYNNFKVPEISEDENYKGDVSVLFEVNKEGDFKVLYVDAVYKEFKDEVNRVFDDLPKIKPATYNGKPTFKQFTYILKIPLQEPTIESPSKSEPESDSQDKLTDLELAAKKEFDSVTKSIVPYQDLEYTSQLNIPFTHQFYSRFDRSLNLVGTNSHTAAKPYIYEDVSKYYDLKKAKDDLKKEASSKWSQKLWNEHLVQLQSKNYWFTIDPVFDLQVGKDTDADFNSTFNNTRGIYVPTVVL